ncbi:MAG: hypothetical protein Q4E65_09340 [Clostridia bacterium]|nr:hypothetical protein [Clostridia bacterium]
MTKQKHNPLPVDTADVISAGEMTGAIPLPPLDAAAYESYKDLMDIDADAEEYEE